MNRESIQKGLLLILSIAAGIVVSEGLLRLRNPGWIDRFNVEPHPSNMYLPDRSLGYRLRPGFEGEFAKSTFHTAIRIDPDGFRSSGNRGSEYYDRVVLVLGDSFTFGIGVDAEDSFCARLEDRLNAYEPDTWRVVNAGVPGYGTYQEMILLREVIGRVQPDLVIVAFYPNDLLDNAVHGISRMEVNDQGHLVRKRIDGGEKPLPGEAMNNGRLTFPFKDFLRDHSALYEILQKSYHRITDRIDLPEDWVRSGETDPYEAYSRLGGDYLYLGEENGALRDLWRDEYDCLDRMIELSTSSGSKFILMLIPTDNRVYPEPWRDEIRWLNLDPGIFDPEKVGNNLARHLMGHDADAGFLDLTPWFVDVRDSGGLLYYRSGDRHLTPEGHRAVADGLYRFIHEGGFLDV